MAYLPSDSALPTERPFKIPYRIFVGGIAFNTTTEELNDFFSRYGPVRDAKIIRDLEGLSKGYGFVTFYQEEDAQKVIRMGTIFFKEKRLNISNAFRKPQSVELERRRRNDSNKAHQQPIMTVPVAAPTTWASSSSTNMATVYYTSMNQGAQIQPSYVKNWSPVAIPGVNQITQQPGAVYWLPLFY